MLACARRGWDSGGGRMRHMEWNESENEWRVNRKRYTAQHSAITTESKKVCDVVKWRNRQLGASLHAQVIIIIIIIVCITNVQKVLFLYFLVSALFYAMLTAHNANTHTHTHTRIQLQSVDGTSEQTFSMLICSVSFCVVGRCFILHDSERTRALHKFECSKLSLVSARAVFVCAKPYGDFCTLHLHINA